MAKRWYVVKVSSRCEKKVQSSILEKIEREGKEELFGQILVPVEEIIESKGGVKRRSNRQFYPGYVLVEMEMNDKAWHLVNGINDVFGFIGGTVPQPITQKEADTVLQMIQESGEKPRPKTPFVAGEDVRVIDGPFLDFNGSVEEVSYEKSRLRVMVRIFGRLTPLELDFSQVEKC